MKEENNGAPKNKWSRIFRKKWFFPAVYLTIAALLLSLVVWYQNLGSQIDETQEENTEDYAPIEDEEAQPVMEQQEVVQSPVENMDQAEIVTKYYDYDADQETQENAIVVFNDRYYQSTGIDIASAEGESFDVLASLSGTVTEVKEDPLLGNVVTLTHENDVTTHYASLGDVEVSADDEVAQGDVIGTAGQNLFGKDNGTHLHFEIRNAGEDVNPESYFNQPLSALEEAETENGDAQSTDGSEHGNSEPESSEESSESESTEEGNTSEEPESGQNEDGTSEGSESSENESGASEGSESSEDESGASEDSQSSEDEGNTSEGSESSENESGAMDDEESSNNDEPTDQQ